MPAARDLLPAEHFLDSGYASGELIVGMKKNFGVTLVTPVLMNSSPQRQWAAVELPSHLRRRAPEAAVTLLSALLVEREREVTDALVDLLIATVHRRSSRASSASS